MNITYEYISLFIYEHSLQGFLSFNQTVVPDIKSNLRIALGLFFDMFSSG